MADAAGTMVVASTDRAAEMVDAIWECATDLTAVTLAGAHASTAETLVIVVTETVALAMAHVSAATTATVASVAAAALIAYRARLRATTLSVIAPARLEPVRAVHVLP